MRCPRCSGDLERAIRQGVEIDYCTGCLGVWFDRGEVERVFHRLSAVDPDDLPERWEPLDPDLAPTLFAELAGLSSNHPRRVRRPLPATTPKARRAHR